MGIESVRGRRRGIPDARTGDMSWAGCGANWLQGAGVATRGRSEGTGIGVSAQTVSGASGRRLSGLGVVGWWIVSW